MNPRLPGGLRPKEIRNIAGVAGVGFLLVVLIGVMITTSVIDSYPIEVVLVVIGACFAIAGVAPMTLPTVKIAETRLIVVFLFVMAATAGLGLVIAVGVSAVTLSAALGGVLLGAGARFSVRNGPLPDHSMLVILWNLFLCPVLLVGLAMGHLLVTEAELAAIIVIGFLAVVVYLVHTTLIEERDDQINAANP